LYLLLHCFPQTLSASDLAVFKIIDLVELAAKKGCSPGRNATRDSVVNALVRAGVSQSDLTKGQLADLKQGAGSSSYSSSPATSSGDRFANYSRSSSASSTPRASGHSGGATLSAGDLSAFKIVDLVEIAAKKGVQGGRNATRDSLVQGLVRSGVSLNDLSRGQLVDLGIKLGKAGLSRDINQARAELASLIGGSGSAPSRWVGSIAAGVLLRVGSGTRGVAGYGCWLLLPWKPAGLHQLSRPLLAGLVSWTTQRCAHA
jgi:hypothetical protein